MRRILLLLLPGLLVLAVYGADFLLQPLYTDAGVFLHAGSRILEGGVPYLDVWDHKGPGIALFAALGLWLEPKSGLGALSLESLLVAGALSLVVSRLARDHAPWAATMAGLFIAACLARFYEFGLLTETVFLPVQALALLAFADRPGRRKALVLGAALAWGLLLRPNLALTPAVLGAASLWSLWRKQPRAIPGWLLHGGVAAAFPLALVAGWLGTHGALAAAWDQAVVFNLHYIGEHDAGFRAVMLAMIAYTLLESGLLPLALAGAATVRGRTNDRLLVGSVLAFTAELAFLALSGRMFAHYLVVLLIPGGVLVTVALDRLAARADGRRWPRDLAMTAMSALVLFNLGRHYAETFPRWPAWKQDQERLVAFIAAHSAPGDTLLVLGLQPGLHVLSGREAPTRYAYQSAFLAPGYLRPEMIGELEAAVAARPPAVIVDAGFHFLFSAVDGDPPPRSDRRDQALDGLRAWVRSHYDKVETMPTLWGASAELYLPTANPKVPPEQLGEGK